MPQPKKPTADMALARRIVRDLMIYTRGQQQRWVPVETIERRLELKDHKATDAALALAIEKGWLSAATGHAVGLTDAGRKVAKV
jgi:Mn-dependent DtxR family transcriptional regulator